MLYKKMNLYGLKYGISMTLEELLNKEVIVSMPDKIIKLKEFYNDTGDLEDLKYLIDRYPEKEILEDVIDDMYIHIYDFIDSNNVSIKWKS